MAVTPEGPWRLRRRWLPRRFQLGRCLRRQPCQHQYRQHQPQRQCSGGGDYGGGIMAGQVGAALPPVWRRAPSSALRPPLPMPIPALRILVFILPIPDLPELRALLNGRGSRLLLAISQIDTFSEQSMRISPIHGAAKPRPMVERPSHNRAPGDAKISRGIAPKWIKYDAIFGRCDNFALRAWRFGGTAGAFTRFPWVFSPFATAFTCHNERLGCSTTH